MQFVGAIGMDPISKTYTHTHTHTLFAVLTEFSAAYTLSLYAFATGAVPSV